MKRNDHLSASPRPGWFDSYIHTTDHILHNMLLQIWNFLLKTPLTEMALTPIFFNKFAIFFKDSGSLDTYLRLGCPKLVPYYCDLLSNLHPKWRNFRRKCRASK